VAREVPARLVLIGDGPDRSAAEWLAHDLGIQSRVQFLGKQERVNELLPLPTFCSCQRARVLRPGRAGGHGLQGPLRRNPRRRRPGADRRWRHRLLYPVGDVDAMADGVLSLLKDRPTP